MDASRLDELNFFCRLCMQRHKELVDIYENDVSSYNSAEMALSQMISACVSIEVSLFNREPRKICSKCLNHLNAWYDFKMTCDAANNVLQKYLRDDNQEKNITTISAAKMITEDSLSFPEISLLSCDTLLEKSMNLGSNISSIVDYFLIPEEKEDKIATESIHSKIDDDFCQEIEQFNSQTSTFTSETISIAKTEEAKPRNKKKSYHCELCDRTFSHFSLFLSHDENIHSKEMKKYTCSICGRLFILEDRLNIHTKLVHRQKTYQCPICDKFYISKKSLEVHSRLHSEKYKCVKCGFLSTSKLYLNQHLQKHEGFDVFFTCNICEQKFSQKSSLLRHNKLHLKSHGKSFKCSICHSLFRSHSELELHKNTHNGAHTPATHKCKVCYNVFSSQKTLKVHQKKHQESQFHFHCNVCEKKFKSNYDLRIHIDTHSDCKTFDCFHCRKKFSFRSSLIKHIKKCYPRVRSDLIV